MFLFFVIVMGMGGRLAVSEVVYFAGYFYKDFICNDFAKKKGEKTIVQ